MGAAGPPPEETGADGAAAPARPRLRITGIAGALAALLVGLSFLLPWAHVDPQRARQFRDAVESELGKQDPAPTGGEDFRALAATMVNEGVLKGTDFIRWVRAAKAYSRELDATESPGVEAARHQRRLELVRILLYGIPIGAFLLAAHFLFHRCRRARCPVLVLCILVGSASVVLAGALRFAYTFIGQTLHSGPAPGGLAIGWNVLLLGGAALGLAGFFGVSARNWFRTYVVSAVTAAALTFLALRYLERGGLT